MKQTVIEFYVNQLSKYAKLLEIPEIDLLEFAYEHYPEDFKDEMKPIFLELFKKLLLQ